MRTRWHALFLVAVALAVRLAAAEMAFRADRGHLLPDEARYLAASRDIPGLLARWEQGGFDLPPGYPALLAVERKVSDDLGWLRFCGALLGAASCLALLPLGGRWGWWAGWIAALSPLCAASSAWLLSESLFVPLLILIVWSQSRGTLVGGVLGGLLMVLAQLVRPLALPLAGLACLWHLASGRCRAALAVLLGVWLALLGLGGALGMERAARLCLPWDRLTHTFRQGWSEGNASGYGVAGVDLPAGQGPGPAVEGWGERARRAARKVRGLWRPVPRTSQLASGWTARICAGAWVLTYPAALLGWVLALRSWRSSGFMGVLPLYITAVHIVTLTSLRYRMPLEPFLVCWAVGGYVALSGWGRRRVF